MEENKQLIAQILQLKKEKNAIILVHNYQRPEMYKIADFIGDSLGLSKKAAETNAKIIVFCGVSFMAETAKILSPEKMVLLPSLKAGCSLSDMADAKDLEALKAKHPNAGVVSYVNTTAAIKALSDACCTSMNAVKVVESLPHEEIIFLPDRNLAKYVIDANISKKIIVWDGYCEIHNDLEGKNLDELKRKYPDAKVISHPECSDEVLKRSDHVTGTGGMVKFAKEDESKEFIIATECGMSDKLKQDVPDKMFHGFCNVCPYMKETTLPLVLEALQQEKNQIEVPKDIRIKAKQALDRMLEIA
jgi:quinolinate synthase